MTKPVVCYSASEVAAVTGLSLSMVRKLTKNRVIPHLKVGRRILYPVAALETWMALNTTPAKDGDANG